jgi:hypothetical protein
VTGRSEREKKKRGENKDEGKITKTQQYAWKVLNNHRRTSIASSAKIRAMTVAVLPSERFRRVSRHESAMFAFQTLITAVSKPSSLTNADAKRVGALSGEALAMNAVAAHWAVSSRWFRVIALTVDSKNAFSVRRIASEAGGWKINSKNMLSFVNDISNDGKKIIVWLAEHNNRSHLQPKSGSVVKGRNFVGGDVPD